MIVLRHSTLLLCLFAWIFSNSFIPAQTPADSVGGGILHGGMTGEYFSNSNWTAPSAFTRRDLRLGFDWRANESPGGSIHPAFASVPADQFSVRWTGQIAPRFSENYQFSLEVGADETSTIELKEETATSYQVIPNNSPVSLTAGTRYDLRVSYREASGPARCILRWSSPSTPLEVIDSASLAAINIDTYSSQLWANALDSARDEWRPVGGGDGDGPPRDAEGWPLGDGTIIVWEGQKREDRTGKHTLRFTGRAQVATAFFNIQFSTGNTQHGLTLPFGAGYDAASNTTTATMDFVDGAEILYLTFTQTRRLPTDTTATGVSKIQLLRPGLPNGQVPQPIGSIGHAPLKKAVERFTALRWILNFDTEQTWAQRRLPNYSTRGDVGRLRNWEHMVMMSNETGKDLYLCLPVRATDDYITKVAQLIRYGSDGFLPYTSPQTAPVYPPLNPNLRVYVERENEIWNFAFTNFGNNLEDLRAAALANTPDWQAANYDGSLTTNIDSGWLRWHALRTVRTSQFFRSVWGDAAMGSRIRVLYEYQYDNANSTASEGLYFIDRYFNNSDGIAHVPDPHPVAYHLWGGGGAVYYGSGNPQGNQTEQSFSNSGFEDGTASWVFTGTAGVYQALPRTEPWTAPNLGTTSTSLPQNQALGLRFTVGPQALTVYSLGRYKISGNTGNHQVHLLRASDRSGVASVEVRLGPATAGQYVYANLEAPVTLAANTSYYLVSDERPGQDAFYQSVAYVPIPGITIDASSTGTYGNPSWDSSTWTFMDTPGSNSNGAVNLLHAPASHPDLGHPPDPPQGNQAAYLLGLGQMRQTLNFTRPGTYALSFQAAARYGQENSVRFYFDDQIITPNGEDHSGPRLSQWIPGEGFNRSSRRYEINTTYIFQVSAPGNHTLRIEGMGLDRYSPLNTPPDLTRAIYFDQINIASADALFEGGIPGAGEANGQVASFGYQQQLFTQQRYAEAFGLRPVAYEGGWSVGGDFNSNVFQNWCKYLDPRARIAQKKSIDIFARSGSRLYVFGTYETWPNESTDASGGFPLAQAIDDHNSTLPPAIINGITLPNTLRSTNSRWQSNAISTTGQITSIGGFFSWNVLVPAAGNYTFTAVPSGMILELDGAVQTNSTVFLTPGLHAVRLRSTSASVTAPALAITQAGAPDSPVLQSVFEGDARATMTWASVPGATSYLIRYGPSAGQPEFSREVLTASPFVLTSLENGVLFYFTVSARNASGTSLPSNELATTPTGPGQVTTLATWEFTGLSGLVDGEPGDPPDNTSGNAIVSQITRGSGLSVGYNQFAANTFASGAGPGDYAYGTDLATAITRQQYYEIQLSATPGRSLSFQRIDFRPYFQAQASGAQIGAGITYRTGSGPFVNAPVATGIPVTGIGSGANLSVDLSGQTALQASSQNITFRIYLWGCIPYGCTGIGGSGNDLVVTGSYQLLPTALDDWRSLHQLPADGSQDLSNPSGDGISNLLKYAFNLAPNAGDLQNPANPRILTSGGTRGLPLIQTSGSSWQFEFIRRKSTLTYQLEISPDLSPGSWLPVQISPQVTSIDSDWERVAASPALPANQSRSFLRMRVITND